MGKINTAISQWPITISQPEEELNIPFCLKSAKCKARRGIIVPHHAWDQLKVTELVVQTFTPLSTDDEPSANSALKSNVQ